MVAKLESNKIQLDLIKENVTAGTQEVIYPDASPSVPDGQVVWEKARIVQLSWY